MLNQVERALKALVASYGVFPNLCFSSTLVDLGGATDNPFCFQTARLVTYLGCAR